MPGEDEIFIEELEELELDATPAPAARVSAPPSRSRLSRLADRAPTPKSAMDILDAAKRAEEAAKEAELEAKRQVAAEARARVEAARRRAEADAEDERRAAAEAEEDSRALDAMAEAAMGRKVPRAPRPLVPVGAARSVRAEHTDPVGRMVVEAKVEAILAGMAPGFEVQEIFVQIPVALVGPLWQAHHVRALHEEDLPAAHMIGAVRRVVADRVVDVVAARVERNGRTWAVWFDLDEECILAVLSPAEVFLVGLG